MSTNHEAIEFEIDRLQKLCREKDDEIERLRARLMMVAEMTRVCSRDSFRDLRKSGVIIGVFNDDDVLCTPEEIDYKKDQLIRVFENQITELRMDEREHPESGRLAQSMIRYIEKQITEIRAWELPV